MGRAWPSTFEAGSTELGAREPLEKPRICAQRLARPCPASLHYSGAFAISAGPRGHGLLEGAFRIGGKVARIALERVGARLRSSTHERESQVQSRGSSSK